MGNESRRDNFSGSTIKLLYDKVNGLCSKPDCRILTRGPNSKVGKITSIGQAAHITAAAKGGPRYDASLTKEQRKSYENGIWLCNNHARIIDSDEIKYPPELLENWRSETEKYVEENIGKPLISEEEANNQSNNNIANFFIGEDFSTLSNATAKMASHIDSKISALDPRFTVKTDIIDSQVTRYISAKAHDVSVTLNISEEHSKEFVEKFDKFKNFGQDFEFSTEKVSVDGSELFKKIIDNAPKGSKITWSAPECILDGELYASDGDNSIFLGGFKAKFQRQKDLDVLTASALKGFIVMRSLHGNPNGQMKCQYSFDFSKWVGIDIQKIPFFPKLKKILPTLSTGGNLFSEINGGDAGPLIAGDTKFLTDRSPLNDLLFMLTYVDCARTISKALSTPLTFDHFHSDQEGLNELCEISSLLATPTELKGDEINQRASVTLIHNNPEAHKNTIASIVAAKCFRIRKTCKIQTIFNQQIMIPDIIQELFDVELEVTSTNVMENGTHETKIVIITNENTRFRKSLVGFS